MKKYRLGVIGAGLIWLREHQRQLNTLQDVFEPVAFCELNADRRVALSREYPAATITDDVARVLAMDEVDIVLVLTPIALNAPMALAAVRAGKHVIMEKPIARSKSEAAALIEAARARDRRLCVAEHMAYRPSNAVIAAQLASGAIGDLVMWECVRHWAGDPDSQQGAMRYDSTPWRKAPDYPLGALFDGGIHTVSILSSLFDQPSAVTATGRKLRDGYGDYDHVAVYLQYANNICGTFSFSQWMPMMQSRFHVFGTRGMLRIEAQQLVIQTLDGPDVTVPLPVEDGRAAMWHEFATVFQQNREPLYTAAHAAADVAMLEGVAASLERHERIAL